MKTQQIPHTRDSIDYCIDFWDGCLDDEEIALIVTQELNLNGPRHVRAFDDVA